ncbi:Bifunctional inhibitor/lipid-transfer protein/seed storage 2S albumin superfamily protein [Striga hermonthica]|uniref:Bifunctional inhibitor/lipid-transfer protein/seed storage 2S albumin superfamily protein n=1 Tax=Striga hermonthica TaxID=68872 RepID=A0A9N7P427_STRHE|nr:Bifunctional inhibitor/lipid-transfer protein/seed storage 2S albumin superfamily protein [Striga hermonthica]
MAPTKNSSSIAIFLALNLVFFTLSSACGTCPTPKPKPPPKPKSDCPPPPGPSHDKATCPRDTLKLGVCADLLGGLIDITIGTPPVTRAAALSKGWPTLRRPCACARPSRLMFWASTLMFHFHLACSLTFAPRRSPRDSSAPKSIG